MEDTEKGAGRAKVLLSYVELVLTLVAIGFKVVSLIGWGKLPDTGVLILGSAIFGLFFCFCLVDMLWWRAYSLVWLFGATSIAVASFWWVAFLQQRGIVDGLIPEAYFPGPVAYISMAVALCLYCLWDLIDARRNEYRDEWLLVKSSWVMITAIVVWVGVSWPTGA